jgi:uncharacterized protein YutE (UPF0331/DUF86 family)
MTDLELLTKKLAEVETYVRELRTLSDIARLRTDIKEQRFIAHTLQLAIQAALDASSNIVSDDRLGEPRTNRELFTLLEQNAWLAASLAQICATWLAFATSSFTATTGSISRS